MALKLQRGDFFKGILLFFMKFCPKLKSENNITFHQDVFCGMQEVKKYYISFGLLYKKVNSFTIPKQFV